MGHLTVGTARGTTAMASLTMHGIKVKRRGNAARMIVGTPPLMQVLVAILTGAGLFGLIHLQRQGEFTDVAPPWAFWTTVSAVALCVLYRWLFHHTLITVKGKSVAVERHPIPFPLPYSVRLGDIKSVDTDVKVTTRRDKYGNEHDSYRFTVQLSLESDWRPKRLYKTSSEAAAVAFRQTVLMMIENARAMNRPAVG
jgi:hypothetical protein